MEAQAILFDLDGVLTDTAHYHYLAWKKLADSLGFHFNEKDNERLKGVDRMRSFEIVLEINDALDQFDQEARIRYADEKNEWYKKLIEQITPADILPGISRFLDQAKQKGMKLAVASSSKNAKRVLELLGITDCFDYVANAAHIAKSKPAPDIFLDCARGLGVLPEQCIGVEDAQAGVEAIHSAGMFSVGIHVDVTSLAPDVVLNSTTELDLNTILEAYEKKVDFSL